jgi:hypothetical protein
MPLMTVTGVDKIVAEFAMAEQRTLPEVMAVVSRGAVQIKKDWAQRWGGLKHAPALPRSIGYDLFATPLRVGADIGPDKNKPQGALGNLVEFGSLNNSPRPGGSPALDAEAPKFIAAMEALTKKLLP